MSRKGASEMKKKEIFEILDKIEFIKDHFICDGCLRNIRLIIQRELKKEQEE